LISIVICARGSNLSDELSNNIKDTIGVPYEVIIIDNSANKYTIFEAYNIGVEQSKFPYLCFMHDDIYYHTNNWGKLVEAHFSDEKTGAIGIAGTPYVPLMPGAWWDGEMVNVNIIPWNATNGQFTLTAYPPVKTNKNRVVVIDGVWFCIKKAVFDQVKFDEEHYKGFHYYDVDISLQAHQAGYHVYSIFDILIEHFSKGDMNKNWCNNALVFKNKWQAILPVAVGNIPYKLKCEAELKTLNQFTYIMRKNGVSPRHIYQLAFNNLVKFHKGYFYYKIPLQLGNYIFKFFTSR